MYLHIIHQDLFMNILQKKTFQVMQSEMSGGEKNMEYLRTPHRRLAGGAPLYKKGEHIFII